MNPNTATFKGNLADNPKLVQVQGGVNAVLAAVVLANRRTKKTPTHAIGQPSSDEGQRPDAEPTRHRTKACGRLAEDIATMPKRSRVLVVGHTETEPWIDPGTHTKRTADVVVVDATSVSSRFNTVTTGLPTEPAEGMA